MSREEACARLIAVWVPDWPVAALGLEAQRSPGVLTDPALVPVAVVGGHGVVAASPRARSAGVRTGMRLRRARSLCPELTVLPAQPEREARSFERVMQALSTVLADPVVARPGLALSGARGPARWLGSEEEVAESLVEAVARETGVECLVGIADSLLACILAARRGVIVPAGQTAEFLSPWPVSSVLVALATRREREQMKDLIETLTRLGLRRLGDLAQVPEADVTARFGPMGRALTAWLAAGPGSCRAAAALRRTLRLLPSWTHPSRERTPRPLPRVTWLRSWSHSCCDGAWWLGASGSRRGARTAVTCPVSGCWSRHRPVLS